MPIKEGDQITTSTLASSTVLYRSDYKLW